MIYGMSLKFPKGWTLHRRKSKRVRKKVIEYIEQHTEGLYSIGPGFVAFELPSDYLIFRMRYNK